jgi:ABC-2 type transport system permease protein
MVGFGLATVFRQSAMAIGLGLAYVLLIENLVFGLLGPLGGPLERIHEWFPIAAASDLQQSFGQAASVVGIEIVHTGEVDIARAVLVLVLWACGLAVLSGALVRFRDIV